MSFSWIPILGHALEFGSNPIKTLQKLSKNANGKIKDIFGLVLAGKRIILINDPLSFKVIFKSKKEVSVSSSLQSLLILNFLSSHLMSSLVKSSSMSSEQPQRRQMESTQKQNLSLEIITTNIYCKMRAVGSSRIACKSNLERLFATCLRLTPLSTCSRSSIASSSELLPLPSLMLSLAMMTKSFKNLLPLTMSSLSLWLGVP
jgi:hypothetical protein